MGRSLQPEQEEVFNKRKEDKKKSKKDKKRKLAAEAEEEAAATEEVAKISKKRAKDESAQGEEAENSGQKVVAVTGKGFTDAKYAPLSSFVAAALPPQVLDCCKGFARAVAHPGVRLAVPPRRP
ncbi:hypothetical protein GUJ93_ZPchr0007g5228 [Zizania palustris]|uniref:Uncharacterized protein n=1 Tax=Zizania palustris TaxID=103762 RepID=A0A8J5TGA4_ZIZPA|nr:hypothetical protein GUJ93_ZPchr0007g5228 [Zizania palustris]